MEFINNKNFPFERALYNLNNAEISYCTFCGVEDGESALKECSKITVSDCLFSLRYPLWHLTESSIKKSFFENSCRAPLWYCYKTNIYDCKFEGVKALRESNVTLIKNCVISSEEFGWKCKNTKIISGSLKSEYAFFENFNLVVRDLKFEGKYSFQYLNRGEFNNSVLITKDAFWHARNVVIKNCEIIGEYLGWYSENLTFINCKIRGTQPFCYCKNLTLINCDMDKCDLAFEYSDVNADLIGTIQSIKNPISGIIRFENCNELIMSNSKYSNNCVIEKKI